MGKYDRKPEQSQGGWKSVLRKVQPVAQKAQQVASAAVSDNPELEAVTQWLSSVNFRKKAVGGLDPADVWKKIEELNGLYEKALSAERVRCNLLVRQLRLSAQSAPPEEANGKE